MKKILFILLACLLVLPAVASAYMSSNPEQQNPYQLQREKSQHSPSAMLAKQTKELMSQATDANGNVDMAKLAALISQSKPPQNQVLLAASVLGQLQGNKSEQKAFLSALSQTNPQLAASAAKMWSNRIQR